MRQEWLAGRHPSVCARLPAGLSLARSRRVPQRVSRALTADEVPAYQTADLRVAWQVTPSIQFSVTGRNLLQPGHEEFASDTGVLVGMRRPGYAQIALGQEWDRRRMTPFRGFRDQPIARKALILGVVPTICALVLASAASFGATYLTARREAFQDLTSQASIVAEHVGAALAFNDRKTAADTVRALRAKDNIESVCIYDATGAIFAAFGRTGSGCELTLLARLRDRGNGILVQHQATVGQRTVGTVVITGNLSHMFAWLRIAVVWIVGAMVSGLLVALAFTRRLQESIAGPIVDLARTADRISKTEDYSVRAEKTTGDEVGRLVESFNAMLDEIQRQNDALIVEIADRKRAEHLKDEFLAAVSHELRTPLNAILGWLQILRSTTPTPERTARALESLERNASSQARLIEDLLEVSRIVTGKLQIRTDVVDLRLAVRAAADVVAAAAAARSLRVTLTLPPTPALVSGDRDRLQQVVWNLLSNSVKFTPPGGVITVDLVANGSDYVLTVADNGVGIAPEFLPHVFERFRQADGSMTRQHGGLGLGLAIVKEATELHGGTVAVSSDGLGQGATFRIRLPQLVAAAAEDLPPAEPRPSTTKNLLAGLRVLIVDDDEDALEIAATALAQAGAETCTVASGPDAAASWETDPMDVLVCDLAMPVMDGFQLLSRIRTIDRGAGRVTRAVALTAYAGEEYRRRSLVAGFLAHVPKPYGADELLRAVATAAGAEFPGTEASVRGLS
jgi:signal transduction histidine kinase/ActR/RegA family two-component response regulator